MLLPGAEDGESCFLTARGCLVVVVPNPRSRTHVSRMEKLLSRFTHYKRIKVVCAVIIVNNHGKL